MKKYEKFIIDNNNKEIITRRDEVKILLRKIQKKCPKNFPNSYIEKIKPKYVHFGFNPILIKY